MIDLAEVRDKIGEPTVEVGADLGVTVATPPLRLDLGCGAHPAEGFTGVDQCALVDGVVECNLLTLPWPFPDNSVAEARCSHFLEHIPGKFRLRWFGELWRVMQPGATAQFITPAADSNRAMQDPTHLWPPVVPEFYGYLSRAWREAQGLAHGDYETIADFEVVPPGAGVVFDPRVQTRNPEFQLFAAQHYRNATSDLYVTIRALKGKGGA